MKKLTAAIIGLSHIHAQCLFNEFNKYLNDIEWIGMADVPPFTMEELERKISMNMPGNLPENGLPKLFIDYKELLGKKPGIAIICTDIKGHADIVEETLGLNIHTIVEKPMATTIEEGIKMYRAANKSNASLAINWPVAWFGAFRKAKELADSGIVGKILRFHYRSPSTRGPYKLGEYSNKELSDLWWYQHDRGGGSIMDYACYGCTLSTWFMGKIPEKVAGFKKNFFLPFCDVEDYSTFTLEYDDAVSIIEGSWSTMNNGEIPTGPIVYGQEGVIVADRCSKEVKVYKDFKPHEPSAKPTEIYITDDINDNIAANFINHIKDKAPLFELLTPDFNLKAMAALDAGIRSCESGNVEFVKNPFQV